MSTIAGEGAAAIRTAVFVDFDNVFTDLGKLDPEAAAQFATKPSVWLASLAKGEDEDGGFRRRFLVRNCYLNPGAFSMYRPYFTRAGFRVVDCPSLTRQGKSSADIHLVLDVLDALAAPTHYDEFILLSADADFTPVALRLRAHDRRVSVVVAGPVAAAYRSVADNVIGPEELVSLALPHLSRVSPMAVPPTPGLAPVAIRDSASPGRVASPSAVLKPGTVRPDAPDLASSGPVPPGLDDAATPDAPPREDDAAVRAVTAMLQGADGPIPGPRVAHVARSASPILGDTRWMGSQSFSKWLEQRVPLADQTVDGTWHHVWDRERFSSTDVVAPRGLMAEVSSLTGAPGLDRGLYAALIRALSDDINANPFTLSETSKRVRDACQDAGYPIGRAAVTFVIQGLLMATGSPPASPVDPGALARAWADNVIGLCRGARMELTAEAEAEIRDVVSGGLCGEARPSASPDSIG